MYSMAPMWNVLFPFTNQLMDILEAPITRSVRSGARGLVTTSVQKTHIPNKELEELKALAYGHDVPEDKLPFVPVTKQGRVIAVMFAQNDLRPIDAFVVKTRLGIKYDAGLKYHAERNNDAFHVQGTHLVLGPRQGDSE